MPLQPPRKSSDRENDGLEGLLLPSLAENVGLVSLYSARANFMVAFFGGPYAAILMSYLNSRRLGRARVDAWVYALLTLLWSGAIVWLCATGNGKGVAAVSLFGSESRALRYGARAIALAVCGVLYLRLRRFYVAGQVAGGDSPSPWKAGLGVVAASTLLTLGATAVGLVLLQRWHPTWP